jgi:hypothetical protein
MGCWIDEKKPCGKCFGCWNLDPASITTKFKLWNGTHAKLQEL